MGRAVFRLWAGWKDRPGSCGAREHATTRRTSGSPSPSAPPTSSCPRCTAVAGCLPGLQLHLPVPAGHQEADEEVRRQRPPLRLHQPEPVPEVLHRQRNNKGVDHLLDIRDQGKDQKSHLKAATPLEHKGAKVNSLRLTTKCKRFIFLAKNETGLLALKSRQIHQGFLG